jgi:dihydropteroate synthase
MIYYRPIPVVDTALIEYSRRLAGGLAGFSTVEVLRRGHEPEIVAADEVPAEVLDRLTQPREPIAGLDLSRPTLMGILNVTPDSFSDGGLHEDADQAVARAIQMTEQGADVIDIGGESTRPGAAFVPAEEEIRRTEPVIRALRENGFGAVISIDTRKAEVARHAIAAGANLFNDVTALRFDPESIATAAELQAPVCLMHTGGDPETMQDNPSYDDVLLDVYDHLSERVDACEAAGIPRERILIDPGIGFGKTFDHNLALLRRLSLFHGIGCGILLGVSRKGFIGRFGAEPDPARRAPGSISVALEGLRQGVQMLRVHDIAETRQAVALWKALAEDD